MIYGYIAQIVGGGNHKYVQKRKFGGVQTEKYYNCNGHIDMRKKQFCYDKTAIPAAKKV